MESEVDLIGMLDALKHVIWLPPGDVLVVVEVGEVVGRMRQIGLADVANVTRLFGTFGAGLRAELAGAVQSASVGRLHDAVERGVHKVRYASLKHQSTIIIIVIFLLLMNKTTIRHPHQINLIRQSNE